MRDGAPYHAESLIYKCSCILVETVVRRSEAPTWMRQDFPVARVVFHFHFKATTNRASDATLRNSFVVHCRYYYPNWRIGQLLR